ncbi:MAG TPA: PLP-dependent aminotransferase family protein [Pyrinomonadaceae bacterium]|nr:PLP-dependent aminotransferase family protein [Pyrinomonadaceae bacterium]
MAKFSSSIPNGLITLDANSETPLYRQLYNSLRRAILQGQLTPGTRLQSSREIAKELNVSRNTVVNAFEQLLAEGYLEGQVGSGTYVSRALPEEFLNVKAVARSNALRSSKGPALSKRGKVFAAFAESVPRSMERVRAFQSGVPALDSFPFEAWSKLAAKYWRRPANNLLGYGEPQGHAPLRRAIASYLGVARAVRCTPEQVIIVDGAQMAFDLIARVLLDPGDTAWMEEPGYLGARSALIASGARLVHVPVDSEGLDVAAGAKLDANARLIYVTPSHQFPLGMTMSLPRRLALLEWASRAGAWVMEDDFDSEYRYEGRPIASLQGLDTDGRVVYIGTFSKFLFPSLRLGYIVAPIALVDAFISARSMSGRHSPSVEQAILTDFIDEGHFGRHIRRMRTLYAERQKYLIDALEKECGDLLEVEPSAAGIQLVAWLPEGLDDKEVSHAAAAHNVEARPLSIFYAEKPPRGGLELGYAAFNRYEIRRGAVQLSAAIRSCIEMNRRMRRRRAS